MFASTQPSVHDQFESAYTNLNPQQKKAVDTIEGPVMVLAGPGTGKTQVLTLRIANILQRTDTQPSNILALTFTESAAINMRSRLVSLIGKDGYSVRITTFHAFCSGVIQQHPEYFPIDRDSQPLTDLELFSLVEKILLETDSLDVLRPLHRPLFYVRELIRTISDLKREGVTPDDFAKIIDAEQSLFDQQEEELTKTAKKKQQKLLAKWREVLVVYKIFQEKLRELRRFDFDDMILLTKQAFSQHEELLLDYQEQYHYFLVDEYQDTNSAQNQVVSLLASHWGDQANLFVVGDPHQSIFRFQGASVENVLSFSQTYPSAQVVTLLDGYRCPQKIYDAAHHLIQHNIVEEAVESTLAETAVQLRSQIEREGRLSVIEAATTQAEIQAIVNTIQAANQQGVSFQEMAVIFRHNRDALAISQALASHDIPFSLSFGESILDNEVVLGILKILQLIAALREGVHHEAGYEVLHMPWFALSAQIPQKLAWLAHQQKTTIWQLLSKDWSKIAELDNQPLSEVEFEAAVQVKTLFDDWLESDARHKIDTTLQKIFDQSGLLAWLKQQPELHLHLSAVKRFFEFASTVDSSAMTQTSVSDVLATIETMQQHQISISYTDHLESEGVTLTTAHKAKGQEWKLVMIAHVVDGKWGNTRKRELLPLPTGILSQALSDIADRNQDDRRLFYVALTRASESCVILYANNDDQGVKLKEQLPSVFLSELTADDDSLEKTVVEDNVDDIVEQTLERLSPPQQKTLDTQHAFLMSLAERHSLSVTGLNTYLKDPELFVEQYLLRVPREKPPQLSFGTALHSALEMMGKQLQQGQSVTLDALTARFKYVLQDQLDPELDAQWFDHGTELLTKYVQAVLEKKAEYSILEVERFFGSGRSSVHLDDIPLIGRVDRIDLIDQAAKHTRVIDYKSGKPKSANFIEGKLASQDLSERERSLPEPIRGPLKRQLLFYKLLAELDQTYSHTVTAARFSFLEPSPSGKLVERDFELVDEDVELLKNLIREVMNEIRSLRFLTQV